MPTQAAFATDSTMHHAYFEPTVGILPNRIKGWNFSLIQRSSLPSLSTVPSAATTLIIGLPTISSTPRATGRTTSSQQP
ncbi:hypothetical protein D5086_021550 [Populus alba]|uniref:Uncharacterized protein n=1 Tax=Populus alba TaxID=43335 RepID=A0ACC4BCH3_POPAL